MVYSLRVKFTPLLTELRFFVVKVFFVTSKINLGLKDCRLNL